MYKIRDIASSLVRAGAFVLLLSAPLAAAPACTGAKAIARVLNAEKSQPVRNAQELSAALKGARGGETFLLASGNYGALTVRTAFRKPVTLRSANAKAPACFTELQLNGAENITLDGVVFDYAYSAGDRDAANRFSIQKSHNVIISNSMFDGDHKAGLGHGRGLRIRDSSSVNVAGNVFRKWWKAVTGAHSTRVTLQKNEFYDIRSDGMGFSGIDGLTIEANRLHNFRGARNKDHRDMLQIMRVTNRRSTDIVIRDNIFDMGAGDYTQTIFMGRSGKNLGDPMLRHQNVMIENNIIYNAQTHGISVNGIDNLSIRRNTVVRARNIKGGGVTIPRIRVSPGSTYVVIEQNAVGGVIGYKNQRNWVVANNAIIQDTSPNAAGFYDHQFVYYATGTKNGYHEYGVRPGSLVDRLNAGSTLAKAYPTRR